MLIRDKIKGQYQYHKATSLFRLSLPSPVYSVEFVWLLKALHHSPLTSPHLTRNLRTHWWMLVEPIKCEGVYPECEMAEMAEMARDTKFWQLMWRGTRVLASMQSRLHSYNQKMGYFSQFHHLLKKKWDWVNFSRGQRFPRIIKEFPRHGWLLCDLHCDVTVLWSSWGVQPDIL